MNQRQIHLDFHTSPYINDVACDFDATAWAKTLKEAHVNSVTVFAKCHHGQCYYPTKTGVQHPALNGRDLLGEQIEALRKVGIACPIYTTIVWEEDVAQRFPEWSQMFADGRFAKMATSADMNTVQPGGWRFNNFINPDYQDYIEAHFREVLTNYDGDGLFVDILFFEQGACWSEASVRFREKHGLLDNTPKSNALFETLAQLSFTEKFTRITHGIKPKASIFYNSTNRSYMDSRFGFYAKGEHQTHFEIESLPSGFWGYYHFPRLARQVMMQPKPWLGMTGRFQKMWGDFGGVKPQPALEYECFRSQALGGACSVGDQLPPRGVADAGAYRLIGKVYEQIEAAEPFYEGSTPLPRVGILLATNPGCNETQTGKSEEGAVLLCDELHYDSAVYNDSADFSDQELIILPDSTVITAALKQKLETYYASGGKLIISAGAGCDEHGDWALDFLPIQPGAKEALFPNYWRARKDFAPELADSDRVIYSQGVKVSVPPACEVLVDRVLPYFKRSDLKLCSHFQTPPIAEVDAHPAVIAGDRFVYFADSVFSEYRQVGSLWIRQIMARVFQRLIGASTFGEGLPVTVLCIPRRKGNDLLLSLLHYIPLRKALDIDVVDERMSLTGYELRLPDSVKELEVFGNAGTKLTRNSESTFTLPKSEGRLLLRAANYFA